jgi:hypothetical protein
MWRLKVKHPNGSTKLYSDFGPDSSMTSFIDTVRADFAIKQGLSMCTGHPPIKLGETGTLQLCGLSDAQLVSIVLPASPHKTESNPKSKARKPKKTKTTAGSSDDEEEVELEDDSDDELAKPRRKAQGSGGQTTTTTTRMSPNNPRPLKPFSGQIAGLRQPKRKIRSTEELGEALAQSAAKNEPRDSVAKFFRRLTKGEVVKRYEIEAANAKYAAVLSKQYEIMPAQAASSYRLSDGVPMEITLHVKYKRGRKYISDVIQGLSEDLLRETIKTVLHAQADPNDLLNHPREGLRPHALPLVSPRVFWSLIYYWKGGGPDCIEKALLSLLPTENWSFLLTRTRKETERSREWRKTETILDMLERGVDQPEEDEDNESELSEIVFSAESRAQLSQMMGITTIQQLAEATPSELVQEDWVDDARDILLPTLINQILGDCSEFVRGRLDEIQIRTPSDFERLRIPGRSEHVVEETKMDKKTVDTWQARAKELIQKYPWLDGIRTRG